MASRIRTSEPQISTKSYEKGREPIPKKLAEKLLKHFPKIAPLPTADETKAVLTLREQLEYFHARIKVEFNKHRYGNTPHYNRLKDREEVVISVLKHIARWAATERDAREQRQVDDKVGKSETPVGADSKMLETKLGSTNHLNHAIDLDKYRKANGIRVLVKISYYSRSKDREILDMTTKITFHALPEKTSVATILQLLGATNSKTDFLDFTLPKESDARGSYGAPINIPSQLRKIGWPGGRYTDGNKIDLGQLFKYVRTLHTEDREPTLRCNFRRVKQDVYDPTAIKVSLSYYIESS